MKYTIIIIVLVVIGFIFIASKKKKIIPTKETPFDISDIKLPYESLIVSGEDAISTCMKLREEGKGQFTPVILGNPKELSILLDGISEPSPSPEEIIKTSQNIEMKKFMEQRKLEDEEYYANVELGQWPNSAKPSNDLTGHTGIFTSRPLKQVLICKVPTPNSWEVPAYLFYGGWNECPSAEEHVAILKYWNEKFGAEIITVKNDVIECTVSSPPQTRDEAMALANEQFFYCADIVYQGTDNLANLASILKGGKTWFFWWD
nr:DUF4253 domain-containing protein [uncultured Desulfobacter sp.]